MELFARFKKDYLNYLLSIILPVVISGISIPLFKQLLGAEGYGRFALWFNAVLILSAFLSGWILQSVLRFFPLSIYKLNFSIRALKLSVKTQLIFALPIGIIVWIISKDIILLLLFNLAVFSCSLYFTIQPILQSTFRAKYIISSEVIRTLVYVAGSVLLLAISDVYYLYALLFSIFFSYLTAFIYLFVRGRKFLLMENQYGKKESDPHLLKKFLTYGIPLSLWFAFSYLLTYADKLFALSYFGAHAQGQYQALFDLTSRGLTILISPVVTSLYPLLTAAYEKGYHDEVRAFMRKILSLELSGFAIASIIYWIGGYRLVLYILEIPDIMLYRIMGYIIICGTFIWQIAILAQKRYELRLKSLVMLGMLILSFGIQIIFYLVFKNWDSELIAPIGYLIAAVFYLSMVSYREGINILKGNILKQESKILPDDLNSEKKGCGDE